MKTNHSPLRKTKDKDLSNSIIETANGGVGDGNGS